MIIKTIFFWFLLVLFNFKTFAEKSGCGRNSYKEKITNKICLQLNPYSQYNKSIELSSYPLNLALEIHDIDGDKKTDWIRVENFDDSPIDLFHGAEAFKNFFLSNAINMEWPTGYGISKSFRQIVTIKLDNNIEIKNIFALADELISFTPNSKLKATYKSKFKEKIKILFHKTLPISFKEWTNLSQN